MNLKKYFLGCILLICISFLCGCVNQGATTEKTYENVVFESDVVKLAHANLEFIQEEMYDDFGESYFVTKAVEARYLFQNPLERQINLSILIEFYDSDDIKLHSIGPREIHLISDYIERIHTPVNIASYNGNQVDKVDYVKIIAFEIV